jgi:hypothetical protein
VVRHRLLLGSAAARSGARRGPEAAAVTGRPRANGGARRAASRGALPTRRWVGPGRRLDAGASYTRWSRRPGWPGPTVELGSPRSTARQADSPALEILGNLRRRLGSPAVSSAPELRMAVMSTLVVRGTRSSRRDLLQTGAFPRGSRYGRGVRDRLPRAPPRAPTAGPQRRPVHAHGLRARLRAREPDPPGGDRAVETVGAAGPRDVDVVKRRQLRVRPGSDRRAGARRRGVRGDRPFALLSVRARRRMLSSAAFLRGDPEAAQRFVDDARARLSPQRSRPFRTNTPAGGSAAQATTRRSCAATSPLGSSATT